MSIVGDAKYSSIAETRQSAFYLHFGQTPLQRMDLVVHAPVGNALELLPAIRDRVRALDPHFPCSTFEPPKPM